MQATIGELLASEAGAVDGVAGRLKVAFTTGQRAVESLCRVGILTEITRSRRDRVFCAREILSSASLRNPHGRRLWNRHVGLGVLH